MRLCVIGTANTILLWDTHPHRAHFGLLHKLECIGLIGQMFEKLSVYRHLTDNWLKIQIINKSLFLYIPQKKCQMYENINCCFYEPHNKSPDSQCNGNKFHIFNIFRPDIYVALCFIFCTIWSVEIVGTKKQTDISTLADTRLGGGDY